MFAGFRRFDRPRHMHLIRQRVVDRVDVRVGEQLFIRSVRRYTPQRVGRLPSFVQVARCNGCHGGELAMLHGRQYLLESDIGSAESTPAKLLRHASHHKPRCGTTQALSRSALHSHSPRYNHRADKMDKRMHTQVFIRSAIAGIALSLTVFSGAALRAAIPQNDESARVVATQTGDRFEIENQAIGAKWSVSHGSITSLVITDHLIAKEIPVVKPFAILLQNGAIYDSANLKLTGQPLKRELTPRPDASRMADRLHGAQFDFPLESSDHSLRAV